MRQMLRMISLYGNTGRSADAPGYRVGGRPDRPRRKRAGSYKKPRWCPLWPPPSLLDAPRYVVVIVVDELPRARSPVPIKRTAAYHRRGRMVGRLVPRIGPMLGVQPDRTPRTSTFPDLRYLVDKH